MSTHPRKARLIIEFVPEIVNLNVETIKALKESRENRNLESFKTLDEFWKAMGIDPNA